MEQATIQAEQKIAHDKQLEKMAEDKRLADVEHVRRINNLILNDLLELGDIDEPTAKRIIGAIVKGKISKLSIQY